MPERQKCLAVGYAPFALSRPALTPEGRQSLCHHIGFPRVCGFLFPRQLVIQQSLLQPFQIGIGRWGRCAWWGERVGGDVGQAAEDGG